MKNTYRQRKQNLDEKKLIKKEANLLIKENEKLKHDLEVMLLLKRGTQSNPISRVIQSRGEVVPIILASDWHYEEKVTKESINNLNEFNLKIADRRITNFFRNTARMINDEQQRSHVDTVILALLGDFISGMIHEPLLPICLLQPMDAILAVQKHLISGIKYLLHECSINKLIIPCTVGNHSRITPKVWIATENGYSLEYLMYHTLKGVFAEYSKKVEFVISNSQHCYIDMWQYKLRFLHGTQIKYQGGLGGFTIPGNRKVNMWNIPIPAYYTFMGHLHQFFDSNPKFLVNGSLIGYSSYALSIGAEWQPPVQSIVFLSKKYGKAGVNPIFLD